MNIEHGMTIDEVSAIHTFANYQHSASPFNVSWLLAMTNRHPSPIINLCSVFIIPVEP